MKIYIKYFLIMMIGIVFVSCHQKEKTNPQRKNIEEAIFGNGFIEQNEDYVVSAASNGIIQQLLVTEGDNISKYALVAIIKSDIQNSQLQDAQTVYGDATKNALDNSPELQQISAQIIQAQQQLNLDKTNYSRYKELRTKNSVSQLDLDNAELKYKNSLENLNVLQKKLDQTKDNLNLAVDRSKISVNTQKSVLNDYFVKAENNGKVIEVFKKKGELVRSGDPIAKIGSGSFRIKLYISEGDIIKVKTGQKAAVNLNTYDNKIFMATITKILPGFDTEEQSYVIEATFDKIPENIYSGTQLQANIIVGNRNNVLVIPTSYLIKGNLVTLEDGTQKPVKTGMKNNEWTEIISGLQEKDIIIKK